MKLEEGKEKGFTGHSNLKVGILASQNRKILALYKLAILVWETVGPMGSNTHIFKLLTDFFEPVSSSFRETVLSV